MNKKRRLPSTDSGIVSGVFGLFFIIVMAIIILFIMKLYEFNALAIAVDNSLAASGLGACVVDTVEYGKSHNLYIDDPVDAYDRFLNTLEENIKIADKLSIEKFYVYNCGGGRKELFMVDPDRHVRAGNVDLIYEAVNQLLDKTSIYVEVSFPVHIFGDLYITCKKDKLVDVVLADE